MYAIGDSVKVQTKFHGWKVGTVTGKADWDAAYWFVEIPGHWIAQTAALEQDMKKIA